MDVESVRLGFLREGLTVPLDRMLPTKPVNPAMVGGAKYAAIMASIREVGLIEPPVVYPLKGKPGRHKQYLLLDGHMRVEILKALGQTEVFCLVSTDDEAYTYNHKVNRLPPIQEHFMILRAIENGVSEERIAKALSVDVARIRQKRDLLNGICPEAVNLLRDKPVTTNGMRALRRVKPVRQIEIAELMIATGNFSPLYVFALIAATPPELRVEGGQDKQTNKLTPEDMARMRREMESLEQGVREVEESYGPNMMNLVLARGYLAKLLGNSRVVRYLSAHYADILAEFEKIVQASSLEK
ncbi:MAG TPA: plasmid partitioning protein RepB C-terminal domain-containing protein [Candidatus Hydrogenedentes bacterium]|nr:plasmid partitioning protein RepB C-terminal domain-containing protein [Candidatus Hydrogenedentota bacterium]